MIRGGMIVKVKGWSGIAFRVRRARGYEAEVVMVGDDKVHIVNRAQCTPLKRKEFCGVCGQMGCKHDGLER